MDHKARPFQPRGPPNSLPRGGFAGAPSQGQPMGAPVGQFPPQHRPPQGPPGAPVPPHPHNTGGPRQGHHGMAPYPSMGHPPMPGPHSNTGPYTGGPARPQGGPAPSGGQYVTGAFGAQQQHAQQQHAPQQHAPQQHAPQQHAPQQHADPQASRLRSNAESFVPKDKASAFGQRVAPPLAAESSKLDVGAQPFTPPQPQESSGSPSPVGVSPVAAEPREAPQALPPQPESPVRADKKHPLRSNDLFDQKKPVAPTPAGQSPPPAVKDMGRAGMGHPFSRGHDRGGNRPKGEKPKPPVPFLTSKLVLPAGSPKAPPKAPIKFDSTWTLFADSNVVQLGAPPSEPSYNPVSLETVVDMEQFWKLWRAVPAPSHRVPNFTYFWFRKKINPTWEDPRNKNGGTLNVVLWDRDRVGLQDRDFLDDAWLTTVMALTGETLPQSQLVNGLALKIRQRNITLQVWTYNALKATVQAIADGLRQLIGEHASKGLEKLDFYVHAQNSPAPQPKPSKGRKDMGRPPMPKREPDFVV